MAKPTFELVILWQTAPSPAALNAVFVPLTEEFAPDQLISVATFHESRTQAAVRIAAALVLTIDFSAYSRRALDRLARATSQAGASLVELARLPDKERDEFRTAFSKGFGDGSKVRNLDEAERSIARRLSVD